MPASQDGSCSFWQDIKAYLSSEKFGQLLSVIDEISWQLEQGSAPSPLHLYMDALSQKKTLRQGVISAEIAGSRSAKTWESRGISDSLSGAVSEF